MVGICAIVCEILLKTISVMFYRGLRSFETTINSASFVVTWRSVILSTSAISCITFEATTEPLSVIITVGKNACRGIM